MTREINESKILTKHVSFKFKCRFNVKKCNSNQKWNKDKYRCKSKNIIQKIMRAKKITF